MGGIRPTFLWALVLALAPAGCRQEDTDCLARIGRKIAARVGALAGDIKDNLNTGWTGMAGGVQGRVASRLRHDQFLADAPIEVRANGKEVELKGTVANISQKQRAVELAETTTGVEKVSDLLKVK